MKAIMLTRGGLMQLGQLGKIVDRGPKSRVIKELTFTSNALRQYERDGLLISEGGLKIRRRFLVRLWGSIVRVANPVIIRISQASNDPHRAYEFSIALFQVHLYFLFGKTPPGLGSKSKSQGATKDEPEIPYSDEVIEHLKRARVQLQKAMDKMESRLSVVSSWSLSEQSEKAINQIGAIQATYSQVPFLFLDLSRVKINLVLEELGFNSPREFAQVIVEDLKAEGFRIRGKVDTFRREADFQRSGLGDKARSYKRSRISPDTGDAILRVHSSETWKKQETT
jgi:hypothetical protein